jgi:hypothetical protein
MLLSISVVNLKMNKSAFVFFAMLCFAATLSIVGCNKNDNKSGDNASGLRGLWNMDSRVSKEYSNGSLTNSTTEPADGSTWDFQDGGILIITRPGSNPETHGYAVQQGNKVNIDGYVVDIQNLTATSVTLYLRHDFASGDYDEVFTNLKR